MFWKLLLRTALYSVTIAIIIILWIGTTQSGLSSIFLLIKSLVPGTLSAAKVQGRLIDKISIQELKFESSTIQFSTKNLLFGLEITSLLKNKLLTAHFQLQDGIIKFKNKAIEPIFLDACKGNFSLNFNTELSSIDIDKIQGSWFKFPLNGYAKIRAIDKKTFTPNIWITLGSNQIKITGSTKNQNELDWFLKINQPNTVAELQGFLQKEDLLNRWSGKVATLKLNSKLIGNWNLTSPSTIVFSKEEISIQTLRFEHNRKEIKDIAEAFLLWDREGLTAMLNIPTLPIQHPNLKGKFSLHFDISQKTPESPTIQGLLTIHPGTVNMPFTKISKHSLSYLGGSMSLLFDKNGLMTQFEFQQNNQNSIAGKLQTTNAALLKNLLEQPIKGVITSKWNDLSLLYNLIPQISNLQASLTLTGKVEGILKRPILHLQANTEKSFFLITKQNINIKNFNLYVSGDIPGKLTLRGSGSSGNGQFQFIGLSEPNDAFKTTLKVTGKNIDVYHIPDIQVIATPDVTIDYVNASFYIQGTIQIPYAKIFLQDGKKYATLSRDVIIINQSNTTQPIQSFKLIPNLYLIIDNQLHFKGYGIDGIIGGKLAIDQRPDGLLSGSGRLTIKEGKYRLQGATRYIHRGYLLFPPGTLLTDPILDIRILRKSLNEQKDSEDLGIYVQGTLQKPLFQPYSSNVNLQSTQILSRLGFGSTETYGDERQVAAQTAFLLAGSANPFIDFLQSNLKLEELNIESKETYKSFYTQGGTDTELIVGKSLSDKIYLQYVQSVLEPIATIRLKYFLNRYFTTSVETGTQGLGSDLTFSMEKD